MRRHESLRHRVHREPEALERVGAQQWRDIVLPEHDERRNALSVDSDPQFADVDVDLAVTSRKLVSQCTILINC